MGCPLAFQIGAVSRSTADVRRWFDTHLAAGPTHPSMDALLHAGEHAGSGTPDAVAVALAVVVGLVATSSALYWFARRR